MMKSLENDLHIVLLVSAKKLMDTNMIRFMIAHLDGVLSDYYERLFSKIAVDIFIAMIASQQ